MKTRSWLAVVLALTFESAGCAGPARFETDSGAGSSVGDACVSTAVLPAATCAEGVLSRSEEPSALTAGSARVLRLHVAADGRASLALEVDTVVTTLSLPAAPDVVPDDMLMVQVDAYGAITLRSEGELLVYVGPRALDHLAGPYPPVDDSSLLEANRTGTPLTIDIAGVPLTLEATCGAWIGHPGGSFGCLDVPMAAFSVSHGDTTVAPGAFALAPLDDGRALAIENRGVLVREEDTTCSQCGDLWPPSFGVTLVVTAAE